MTEHLLKGEATVTIYDECDYQLTVRWAAELYYHGGIRPCAWVTVTGQEDGTGHDGEGWYLASIVSRDGKAKRLEARYQTQMICNAIRAAHQAFDREGIQIVDLSEKVRHALGAVLAEFDWRALAIARERVAAFAAAPSAA